MCRRRCLMTNRRYAAAAAFFLLACLFYIDVINAKLESSKYTVTFKYNDKVNWCLGGIIDDKYIVTSGECFAERRNGLFFNFASLKAVVVGSSSIIESQVQTVFIPKFSDASNGRAVHDFAIVKLKQSLSLQENGLIALQLPNNDSIHDDTIGFVSIDASNEVELVKIDDPQNCPNNDDINFFTNSQLCVELSNLDDSCLHQPGSPLVDENDKLIGIYLDCYDESPHEIFAKVSFFSSFIANSTTGRPGSYKFHDYLKL